jgi:hypothetical protein
LKIRVWDWIDISPMPVRHGQTPARRLHLPESKLGVFVSWWLDFSPNPQNLSNYQNRVNFLEAMFRSRMPDAGRRTPISLYRKTPTNPHKCSKVIRRLY